MSRRNHEIAFANSSTTVSWIELIFEIDQQVSETQLFVDFQQNPLKRSGVVAICRFVVRRGYRREGGTRQRAKFRSIQHTSSLLFLSTIVAQPLLFRTSIDRPLLA